MSDGRWLPDPAGVAERRWQSSSGVWSRWVADGVKVREAPLPDDPSVPAASGPCPNCGGQDIHWKRDRVPFYLCLCLFWPALPFLPKKPYCTRCNRERWVEQEAQSERPSESEWPSF